MITDQLLESINETIGRLDIDKEEFSSCFQLKNVKKGENILRMNQMCSKYYFVNNGAFRIYFLKDGNQFTHWFAFERVLFTELESYNLKQPSAYCIEAIEDSEILTISRSKMEELLLKYPLWQEFLRKNWEYAFIKVSKVIASFQSKSAKERYDELFEYSEILQRTTQRDLSSMLGITQYSLSRIRKERN
ncbi:MAG: Crp/Fnr family transcriptional regulator [Bacteroidota bacterium]